MALADVFDIKGEKVGEVEIKDEVFNCDVKPYLMHDVVTMQLANRRRGTASTKTRKEVRGGGKKAFSTERNRPSSSGKQSFTFAAWWWNGFRAPSERLQLFSSEKGSQERSQISSCPCVMQVWQ